MRKRCHTQRAVPPCCVLKSSILALVAGGTKWLSRRLQPLPSAVQAVGRGTPRSTAGILVAVIPVLFSDTTPWRV